MSYELKIVHK